MRRLVLLAAVMTLGFAPAPLPRDPLKELQGDWAIVSRTEAGRPVAHTVATVEVRGSRWTYYSADRSWSAAWVITVDGRAAPRRYQAKVEKCGTPGPPGIYKVQGDTLTRCYARSVVPPADFDGAKPGVTLEVYRRVRR